MIISAKYFPATGFQKVKENGHCIRAVLYTIPGLNIKGKKELLGRMALT